MHEGSAAELAKTGLYGSATVSQLLAVPQTGAETVSSKAVQCMVQGAMQKLTCAFCGSNGRAGHSRPHLD